MNIRKWYVYNIEWETNEEFSLPNKMFVNIPEGENPETFVQTEIPDITGILLRRFNMIESTDETHEI